ncbi:hypothetical protein [Kitasatospora cineracea]|uniref:Uncharacterized protein n=1 Tax=Kitasatospora cineracea TaxID=88074 RepID=A0A8G1XBQ7_9ACTN|nr:hypothetical protein [Kitasatospora cineracea]ROR42396.1 hypothetical protein EDD39_0512 [Kitasatospora cineracea]
MSVGYDKPLKDVKGAKGGCDTAGTGTDGLQGASVGYALNSKKDGKTYADIRLIGKKAYLKVDVRGIAQLAGEDSSEFESALDQLPPAAAPLKDLVGGKWISVDTEKFEEFSRQMSGSAGKGATPKAAPSLDPSVLNGFCNSLTEALSDNVTLDDLGKSGDADDVIRVSAPARPLVEALYKSVTGVAKGIPGYPKLPAKGDFSDVPDRKLSADVQLKDGRPQAITFDIAQFADTSDWSTHLPLRIGISTDGAAQSAPAGATELDLNGLQEAFSSMSGGDLGDGATGTGFDQGSAAPLTESQYAELQRLGIDRDTAESMNHSGFAFDEIKGLAPQLT